MKKHHIKKVAFIVPEFPSVSLTFIINQIADLTDRGIDVRVFAFKKGSDTNVAERYFTYKIQEKITYLDVPENKIARGLCAVYGAFRLLTHDPRAFFRALDVGKYGVLVKSLYTLVWTAPFLGEKFDLIHCHFGTVATKYLVIRTILRDTTKLVTTFYGYDISHIPQERGMDCYKELIPVCDKFLVMSENMKSRVLPLGVPPEKIVVHPISIDVESYTYHERKPPVDTPIQITSVGRFVEKKGFDDLLRAIKVVKEKTTKPFRLNIVGDGELHDEIHALAKELAVEDVVDFKGFMKLEDVLSLYEDSHLYVQASKTARDGDME